MYKNLAHVILNFDFTLHFVTVRRLKTVLQNGSDGRDHLGTRHDYLYECNLQMQVRFQNTLLYNKNIL